VRSELQDLADERGEALSLIVREAIGEYLAKHAGKSAETKEQKPNPLHRLVRGMRGIKAASQAITAAGAIAWFLELHPANHMAFAVCAALLIDSADGKMNLLGGLRLW